MDTPQSEGTDSGAERELIRRWIDSFNARELEGMLSCAAPSITFQPLRLHGIERTYSGHEGMAHWLERLLHLGLDYQVQLEQLSTPAAGTVVATGRLDLDGSTTAAPVWGVYTIADGLIIVARHYLGDAELAEKFAAQ
jgi:SnoaL-like protein